MSRCRHHNKGAQTTIRVICGGFSLLELLVAMALLAMMSILLVGIAGQAGSIWQAGESGNQHRQRARAALNLIGSELQQAALPLDRSNTNSLRFEISPTSAKNNPQSIFFQAPIAKEASMGRMASLGYFVHWSSPSRPALYRFYLNPAFYDPQNPFAALENMPVDWEDKWLFLENVMGFWVKAHNSDGSAYLGDAAPIRSLPAQVEISMVLLDSARAQRLDGEVSAAGYATASAYVAALPASLRPGATIVSLTVNLDNSLGWRRP